MKNIEPGDWQTETNIFGGKRRFRMVGNTKEYEPMIYIDGIEIPQSEVESYNKRRKTTAQQKIESEKKIANSSTGRICPFKRAINISCLCDCSFYDNGSCVFNKQSYSPTRDTEGLYCPIAGHCSKSCAMYSHGCKLIEFIKGL